MVGLFDWMVVRYLLDSMSFQLATVASCHCAVCLCCLFVVSISSGIARLVPGADPAHTAPRPGGDPARIQSEAAVSAVG